MDHASIPDRLRAAGLRATGPRIAVFGVLDDARAPRAHLSAAEITTAARARTPGISTQAVYDCLDALTRAGLVRRIEPAGHPALFEARVGDNHHHLVCRGCGRTVDVDCTHGAAPCLTPAVGHGFVVDEAEVVFWGLCPECAVVPAGESPATARSGRPAGGPVGATALRPTGAAPRPAGAPAGPTLSAPVGTLPAGAGAHTPA